MAFPVKKKRVDFAKEVAPPAALALAVLYGVGWALRSQLLVGLGVGSLAVSREAAISAALAVLLAILPGVLLSAMLELAFARRPQPRITIRCWLQWSLEYLLLYVLAGAVLYALFVPVAGASPALAGSLLAFLAVQWTVVPVVFAARLLASASRAAWLPLAPLLVLATGGTFARNLLAQMPEFLGGLGRDRVAVLLKDPPDRIVGTLAASDDRDTVLVRVEQGTATVPALRVPNERIVEVASLARAPGAP
jgi:hypothetical protein